MKQLALITVFLFLFSPAGASTSVWTWGYRVTLDGFSTLPENEYLGAHIIVDPLQGKTFSPFLSAGVLMPVFSGPIKESYLEVSGGVTLFHLHDHPLDSLFLRRSTLAPKIEAGMIAPVHAFSQSLISVTASPVTFFFGGRTVSILGLRYLRDLGKQQSGWGVRLFDITHYLF